MGVLDTPNQNNHSNFKDWVGGSSPPMEEVEGKLLHFCHSLALFDHIEAIGLYILPIALRAIWPLYADLCCSLRAEAEMQEARIA